jgi:hypothetical protein
MICSYNNRYRLKQELVERLMDSRVERLCVHTESPRHCFFATAEGDFMVFDNIPVAKHLEFLKQLAEAITVQSLLQPPGRIRNLTVNINTLSRMLVGVSDEYDDSKRVLDTIHRTLRKASQCRMHAAERFMAFVSCTGIDNNTELCLPFDLIELIAIGISCI